MWCENSNLSDDVILARIFWCENVNLYAFEYLARRFKHLKFEFQEFQTNVKDQMSCFRLAQKVSELLDSFKPGTISYRPFKKPEREHRIIDSNNNDEALRQRLYVDLQRPRPFYRTTSVDTQIVNEEIIHRNPPTLQVILCF